MYLDLWLKLLLPNAYVEILTNTNKAAKARIRICDATPEFPTTRRVRQGDTISTKLFAITLENIFRKLDWSNKDLSVDGDYLNHLRYVIANNPEELLQLKIRFKWS